MGNRKAEDLFCEVIFMVILKERMTPKAGQVDLFMVLFKILYLPKGIEGFFVVTGLKDQESLAHPS